MAVGLVEPVFSSLPSLCLAIDIIPTYVRNGIGNASRALAIYYTILYFSPAARAGTPCCVFELVWSKLFGTPRTAALGMKRAFTDHLYFK